MVTDIKCHPDKMHRLLISFEFSGVCVFSINKDRAIYTLALTEEKHFNMGRALSIEWLNDTEILVGFSRGTIEIYKTDVAVGAKPKTYLNFNSANLVTMRLMSLKRAEQQVLIVEY